METKKELTAMDFLTFTVAGNVVVADPVTGREFLCFRNADKQTFTDSRDQKQLKPEEIYALVELRMEQAKRIEAEGEAKEQQAFCVHCGEPLIAGNRFCVKCGKPIGQGEL